jgi:hypothetical protein
MNRLAGIITAAVGFLVALLGILKVVPGGTQAGIVVLLCGGLIIGLSFIDKPSSEGVERMSTGATILNIFIAPGEVFRNLRYHPRWLAALLIMSVLASVYAGLFTMRMTPERITNYAIDKTLEMPMLNDDARREIEKGRVQAIADAKDPVARVAQAVSGFAGYVFLYAFAALIFFVFILVMGGRINYWQAFSAAVYAALPVSVIQTLLSTLVLFIKDPDEIHPLMGQRTLVQDNLGFLVTPSENPVLFTLLGSIGILAFYWIWLLATGLKNTGERVSNGAAWTASIGTYALLVMLGLAMAALFPSFIS